MVVFSDQMMFHDGCLTALVWQQIQLCVLQWYLASAGQPPGFTRAPRSSSRAVTAVTRPISLAGAATQNVSSARQINFSVHSNVSLSSHPRRKHLIDFTAPVETALELALFNALYFSHMPKNTSSWQSMLIAWNTCAAHNAKSQQIDQQLVVRPKLLKHLHNHHKILVSNASISGIPFLVQQGGPSASIINAALLGMGVGGGQIGLAGPLSQSAIAVQQPTGVLDPGGGRPSAAPVVVPPLRQQQLQQQRQQQQQQQLQQQQRQILVQQQLLLQLQQQQALQAQSLQQPVQSASSKGGKGTPKTCSTCHNPIAKAKDRNEHHFSKDGMPRKWCYVGHRGHMQSMKCAKCQQVLTDTSHPNGPCS